MRITCRYSGVSFYTEGFNQLKVVGEHPIMSVDVRTLISRAKDWSKGGLVDTERRLLFIALLKTTELVIFRVPAIPTKQTIERNMALLLDTIGWREIIGDQLDLPKYIIHRDNHKIENIGNYLSAWEDSRKNWEDRGVAYNLRQQLERREKAIHRLIHRGLAVSNYQKSLGRWVIDAGSVPLSKQDYWLSLFSLKEDKQIYRVPQSDFVELLQYMQEHIDASSLIGIEAFHHIHELIKKNEGGMEYGLDGIENYQMYKDNPYIMLEADITAEDEILNEEEERIADKAFTFTTPPIHFKKLTREQQEANEAYKNRLRLVVNAPLNPPARGNYKTLGAYCGALAQWSIADRLRREQAEQHEAAIIFTPLNNKNISVVQQITNGKQQEDTEIAAATADEDEDDSIDDTDDDKQEAENIIRLSGNHMSSTSKKE